ncbi:MAG: hypothetical protein AB1476_05175 [Candidatus Hadarchaeota archaeon]
MKAPRIMTMFNWFGIAAGIMMLALPFMGPWWTGTVGTGALSVGLSPFDLQASLGSTPLQSPLVGFFLLATKITFLIGGTFLILSSIFPKSWWSRSLMGFGVMKPFSSAVFFLLPLIIGALAANILLPSILPSLWGGAGGFQINSLILPIVFIVVFIVSIYALYTLVSRLISKISRETEKSQLKGNIVYTVIFVSMIVAAVVTYNNIPPPSSTQVSLSLPYVSGTATSTIQIGNTATITAPVTLALTGVFWIAVVAAALGVVTRIYHGRFIRPTMPHLAEEKHAKREKK